MITFAKEMKIYEIGAVLRDYMMSKGHKPPLTYKKLEELVHIELRNRGLAWVPHVKEGPYFGGIQETTFPYRTFYTSGGTSLGPREDILRSTVGYLFPEGIDFPDASEPNTGKD